MIPFFLLLCCLCLFAPLMAAETEEAVPVFDIPAISLSSALALFSLQSGVQVSADAGLVQGRQATALSGRHDRETALRLLLQGSGLDFDRNVDGTFTLRREDTVLPTITVAARAPDAPLPGEPASTSRLSRRDIERTAPRHASDILQGVPGTQTVTNEQSPAVAISIRGLKDFGRVSMSIDGMRQNYQRSGYQQRNGEMFFDPELLSGVEIVKGPQAVAGSAGATGGIARLRTLDVTDVLREGESLGARLRGSSGIGRYANGNTPSGSVAVAAQGEEGDALLAYSLKRSEAYRPGRHGRAFNDGFEFPVNIVNLTGQDQDSLLFKSRWQLLPDHALSLTLTGTRADYAESLLQDRDGAYVRYVTCNPMPPATDPLYPYCRDYGLTAYDPDNAWPLDRFNRVMSASYGVDHLWQLQDERDQELASKLYFVSTENRSRTVSDVESRRVTRTDTYGGAIEWRAREHGRDHLPVSWQAGAEAFLDKTLPRVDSTTLTPDEQAGINGATPRGSRLMIGFYGRLNLAPSSWLTVSPGLSYERYRLWGKTGFEAYDSSNNNQPLWQYSRIGVDHRDGRFLPSLGVELGPWAGLTLFASATRGWRPPAITEALITRGDTGNMQVLGYFPNYRLVPEETDSFELGMALKRSGMLMDRDLLDLRLTGFRHTTTNYILLDSSIGIPGDQYVSTINGMFVNTSDPVIFRGLELESRYEVDRYFFRLGVTRVEREATFRHLAFPLGGAVGPNAPDLNQSVVEGAGFYVPLPSLYSGRVSSGLRLPNQQGEGGVTLSCASGSGHAYVQSEGGQRRFCVMDTYADYRVSEVLGVSVGMKNIFDRQYAQAMADGYVRSYAPGRSVTLAVELNW